MNIINVLMHFSILTVGTLASKCLLPLHSIHFDTVLIMSWIYGEMNPVVEEVQIHAKKLWMK